MSNIEGACQRFDGDGTEERAERLQLYGGEVAEPKRKCVMDTKKISIFSGAALLALAAPAWAGPMSVASEKTITPPMQTEQIHYRYYRQHRHYGWYRHPYRHRHYGWYRHRRWHHGWHYGWYRPLRYGWHYGWYRSRYPGYAYGYYPYYGYGYWNPVGAAAATAGAATAGALSLAAAPFAWATGYPYYYPYW